MLKLYNTKHRKKENFKPIDENNISMYVCGPTVYDVPHLGNARSAVVFDVLFRLLKQQYKIVTYVRNITDIDDKIITAANSKNISFSQLTKQTEQFYIEDMFALNIQLPTYQPKASEFIQETIDLIQTLIDNNFAYVSENHVLFEVQKFKDHGKFSNKKLEDLIAGARVEKAPYKKNPEDFVLWKPSKENEPKWNSPWGFGRMGWHSECASMIHSIFNDTIDIHGGGMDLIFPHHENEVMQTKSAYNRELANFWVHNNMLLINGEKMSKSSGNFLTVRDVLKIYDNNVIRLSLLNAHYRQVLNWDDNLLNQSKSTIAKLKNVLFKYKNVEVDNSQDGVFLNSLLDDLNFPLAIKRIHELVDLLITFTDKVYYKSLLINSLNLLGIKIKFDIDENFIEDIISQRNIARLEKDFKKSDELRDLLLNKNIILKDNNSSTSWEFK
jgi:cysteinyl-tRNA synthetase